MEKLITYENSIIKEYHLLVHIRVHQLNSRLPLNNSYSLGPMFMDYQDVASSKVTFFALKHKMIHYFAIHLWKRDFMDKGKS